MGEGVRPRGEALALALLRLAALPESGRRGVEVCEDACSVRYGCDETPDGWNDKEAVTKPGLRDRANREGFVIDSSAAICRRLFSMGFIALNVPDGNGGTPTNDLIGATFGGCGGRVMSRLFERSPRALKRRRKARCTRQTEAFFRRQVLCSCNLLTSTAKHTHGLQGSSRRQPSTRVAFRRASSYCLTRWPEVSPTTAPDI